MLELVNLSNYRMDTERLIYNKKENLEKFLTEHHLDGIEMMFCEPWDQSLHERRFIQGVHLNFWPYWLEFWRGDLKSVAKQLGSRRSIIECYGGVNRSDWLKLYAQNFKIASQTQAKYFVFHVSHARLDEVFSWKFHASSEEVIDATIDLVNALVNQIPPNTTLLFENLWWPGLTLLNKRLVEKLLTQVQHEHVGIMLDTGHLMNTNQRLKNQDEAIDYVLQCVENLGEYRAFIKGLHLHYSLSGTYVASCMQNKIDTNRTSGEIMEHILKIDEHLPFSTPKVKKLISYIQPEFLVHEFMQKDAEDWRRKLEIQQNAIK